MDVDGCSERVISRLRKMIPGESFVIPGGYSGNKEEGGHAVFYLIERLEGDKFKVYHYQQWGNWEIR